VKYTKPPLKDSVLHLAARRKDNDLVKLFIEAGAGVDVKNVSYTRGKYHCTIDLLFDWFGLVCFGNKNKNCQLSYS
jgi:ankyrin repeat protein